MTHDFSLATVVSIAVIVWAAACGLHDLYRLKVPNYLTLGMWLVAALALFSGQTLLGREWWQGLAGFAVAALLTVPGYALNRLGAGDVKMLMGFGLAAGTQDMLEAFVVASLSAALIMLALRASMLLPSMVRLTSHGVLANLAPREGKSFPFAIFLALGCISSLFFSWF